jgi:uncharacterized membrane protein YvbJ
MPYCPKCGKETGNAKFCPECGAPQGTAEAAPQYATRRKEPYNSWIGAIICCCLTPVPAFVYYYITEPNEDSLNQTFMKVGAICGIGIGILIIFTIFMFSGGADLLGL